MITIIGIDENGTEQTYHFLPEPGTLFSAAKAEFDRLFEEGWVVQNIIIDFT